MSDPRDDLTSSSRTRKVTLLPMLAVSLSSRVVRTKPRGGRCGHCCFLAVYISFTPFVQLFATTLRYLKHTNKSTTSLKHLSFEINYLMELMTFTLWLSAWVTVFIHLNTSSLIDTFWAALVFVAGWIGFGHNLCDTISVNDNRVLSLSLSLSVISHSCSEWICFLTEVGFKLALNEVFPLHSVICPARSLCMDCLSRNLSLRQTPQSAESFKPAHVNMACVCSSAQQV